VQAFGASKLRRKWRRRSGVIGIVRSYVTSHIGISRVGAPSCWSGSSDIAKSDTPISSEPLIMGTRVKESQYLGVRRIGVLDDKERLHLGIRDPRNPDGDVAVWDHGN
jgi:hypothetical protein